MDTWGLAMTYRRVCQSKWTKGPLAASTKLRGTSSSFDRSQCQAMQGSAGGKHVDPGPVAPGWSYLPNLAKADMGHESASTWWTVL